jgi:hypothetical protein
MKREKSWPRFAICIKTDGPDLLTPWMIYQVLPDASAERSKFIRVIDNEGEDYLYPAQYFVLATFPRAIERTLLRAPRALDRDTSSQPPMTTVRARTLKSKPA